MEIHNRTKRRGSFNVVDALIVLVLLAVISVMVFLIFFSDSGVLGISDANEKSRTVHYIMTVEPVDDDFLLSERLPVRTDDSFSVWMEDKTSRKIGKIFSVGERSDYRKGTSQLDEKGNVIFAKYPGYSSFELIVESAAVLTDTGAYRTGEIVIGVGDEISFSTPYFSGTAKCTGIQEVVTDGK